MNGQKKESIWPGYLCILYEWYKRVSRQKKVVIGLAYKGRITGPQTQ